MTLAHVIEVAKRKPEKRDDLLRQAKVLLNRAMLLHIDSVAVGRLEQIPSTCELESRRARYIIEESDRVAAEIAVYLEKNTKGVVP